MNKLLIIAAITGIAISGPDHAWAINHISECIGGTCPSNGTVRNGQIYGHCTNSTCDCATQTVTYTVPCHCETSNDCNAGYGCNTSGLCVKCKTCSNCTSDASYSAYGTGYERRTIRTCTCDGTCNTSYSYRCARGYFGTSSNGTSGCSQCWPPATTATAGATKGTECYMPAGAGFSDSTGSGTYTGNCYYTN